MCCVCDSGILVVLLILTALLTSVGILLFYDIVPPCDKSILNSTVQIQNLYTYLILIRSYYKLLRLAIYKLLENIHKWTLTENHFSTLVSIFFALKKSFSLIPCNVHVLGKNWEFKSLISQVSYIIQLLIANGECCLHVFKFLIQKLNLIQNSNSWSTVYGLQYVKNLIFRFCKATWIVECSMKRIQLIGDKTQNLL